MKRRSVLGLGLAGGAALLALGAVVVWRAPAWRDGALLAGGRRVLEAVARAVLDGSLPTAAAQRDAALAAHLTRVESTLAAMPPNVQAEVAQLLSVLDASPGRLALTGLTDDWPVAPPADVQAALMRMRASTILMRRQVYAALRDLTHAAWFADPSTWAALGYPGPRSVS